MSYYNKNLFDNTVGHRSNETYNNRIFQEMDGNITGRSVVIEDQSSYLDRNEVDDIWPYSLTDYLKRYIGSMVQVEYVLQNNRFSERRGKLKVVGTDFIGIMPYQSNNLLLLELNSIRSINIINNNLIGI